MSQLTDTNTSTNTAVSRVVYRRFGSGLLEQEP